MIGVLRVVLSLVRVSAAGAVLLFPAWWAAGRIRSSRQEPFFRLLVAVGLALFDFIIVVNLAGRFFESSFAGLAVCFLSSAGASAWIWVRRPREELAAGELWSGWKRWLGPVALAVVLGAPQWLIAVSTNYWDEAVASTIHLTGPSQFAEGLYPPRHNALPDVPIKYHYGFVILSGTAKLLLGIPANNAVDVVSTGLWLFVFLFVFFWFRELDFDGLESAWAAFALLLGGGLAWLYLPRVETYSGLEKTPAAADLLHRYEPAKSWLANLIQLSAVPSQHLRNADGTLSNLPWDVAAQFQQHAVSLGIAMTAVGLYLFTVWRARAEHRRALLGVNVAAFSVILLGHAVFGTVAAFAAGCCLLAEWARKRDRGTFLEGLLFAVGVGAAAFLHGGMLRSGAAYSGGGYSTWRSSFGFSAGGLAGFVHWNLAGFGVPLLLAAAALALHRWRRPQDDERSTLFNALAVFAVFSYVFPQLAFYSSENYGVEKYTEITKFFFTAHFGLALLSAYGMSALRAVRGRAALAAVCFLAAGVAPLAYCYSNAYDADGKWLGFYYAPYHRSSIEEQMADAFARLKKGPRDVFFDASADERRHGFLSELLYFGGSAFTLTPSAYERTGVGFRLSENAVGPRYAQNSRVARLLPGAPEAAGCTWYYCRPLNDSATQPLIVRSRFAKLVDEGAFVLKAAAGLRVLYSIEKPTAALDEGIEKYWAPRVVSQTIADCDGSGRNSLVFYDYVEQKIHCGSTTIALPERARGEFAGLFVARFPGEPKSDFLIGRMADTVYSQGKSIEENVEYDGWAWSYRAARDRDWEPEYVRWYWDADVPLVGDLNHSGYASHFAYRPKTGDWLAAPGGTYPGPKADAALVPVPFVGRFLDGSTADLGLWTLMNGMVTLKSLNTGKTVSFRWGGTYGFTLVPGDYDGIGRDQIAVYNRDDATWYWKRLPDGAVSFAKFGTKTSVPVPWDYRRSGRLDLAYWEPKDGKIYVSFDRGRSVGLVVKVPPHSIPAFVNMY
jgi:hypothetical protein